MQETFAMDDQLRDSRERRQPPAARPGSPNKQMSTYVIEDVGPKRTFKIIVIGDSNVGKTCLTYRFCDGKFLAKVEATIGVDFREKDVDVEGEKIKVGSRCMPVSVKKLATFALLAQWVHTSKHQSFPHGCVETPKTLAVLHLARPRFPWMTFV